MEARVTDVFEFGLNPREAVRRLGWSSFGIAASRGKGVVTLPLALWLLGPDGYGFVTVVLSTSAIIAALSMANVPDGAGRLVVSAPSPGIAESRLAAIRRVGRVAALALIALGLIVGAASQSSIVAWSFAVAAGTVFFKVSTVHLEYFQITARLVRIQIAAEYVSVALGLGAAVWLGVNGYLAANVAVIAALGLMAWRTIRVAPVVTAEPGSTSADPGFWRAALKISIPLLPVSLAQWALFSIDSLLVYKIIDKTATGAYSAAYSIAAVGLLLPLGLNVVWPSSAQRLLARSRAELRRMMLLFGAIVLTGGVVLVVAAIGLQPVLHDVLHDPVYHDVPGCVPWIIGGFAAFGLGKLAEGVLYAAAKNRFIVASYLVGAGANIALNAIWIPKYGILGAAYATAAGYALLAVALFVSMHVAVGRDKP